MTASDFYSKAERNGLYLEATCTNISMTTWERLMKGAVRANKEKVHKILRTHDLQDTFWLSLWNPYNYFRTKTHIIYVHSGIEHFYKIN